jgi:hypothetical protein
MFRGAAGDENGRHHVCQKNPDAHILSNVKLNAVSIQVPHPSCALSCLLLSVSK